ncbi:MAG: hypothetical protein FE78DRAFT_441419 [Acidomyces sp. 'richmondensis']|nr:MAG: hypothetical protein FE78DRAFT_441419 [Acidomyces sp. 'richmondensis']
MTEKGRTGMTAIETLPTTLGVNHAIPIPNFDEALGNPLGRMLVDTFQSCLATRDPAASRALTKGLQGDLPGQVSPGARSGDLVVPLVGGFQPYILRLTESQHTYFKETAQQTVATASRHHYVGDCYLHGTMNGEPFKTKGWLETENWNSNVDLIDIRLE